MEVPFGFRVNQIWSFRTATPLSVAIPFIDTFSSQNAIFITDLNGDGTTGDLLPGTNVRALGRSIKSLKELNQLITNFNNNNAGKITPAGQALVTAGIFTEAQLKTLGATSSRSR